MSNLMMPSRVLMYGRTMKGLEISVNVFNDGDGGAAGLGYNKFLRKQFGKDDTTTGKKKPRLAMIYGFEFEGHYYDLTAPTIMLVHGKGINRRRRGRRWANRAIAKAAQAAVDGGSGPEGVVDAAADKADELHAGNAASAKAAAKALSGGANSQQVADAAADAATAANPYVGRIESPFPGFPSNVRVWPYDKADFSLRLDPCSGPIESILLDAELEDDEFADEMSGRKVSGRKVGGYRGRKMSGRKVGIRGRKVRGD